MWYYHNWPTRNYLSFHGQINQKIKGFMYWDQLTSPALIYVACETLTSQINCDKEKGLSISLWCKHCTLEYFVMGQMSRKNWRFFHLVEATFAQLVQTETDITLSTITKLQQLIYIWPQEKEKRKKMNYSQV